MTKLSKLCHIFPPAPLRLLSLSPLRMTLDTSKAALFIEHSERARQLGHKARFCSRYNEGSLRLFTRQRALTPTLGGATLLAVGATERSRSPPFPPAPSEHHPTPTTLSVVFQPYYPTPRDQCS